MSNKKPVLWNSLSQVIMRLPNIGLNNAKRISIYLMNNKKFLKQMIDSMEDVYQNIQICKQCRNFSVSDFCEICSSDRDKDVLCIVKSHIDMFSIEASIVHNGLYYILGEDFNISRPGDVVQQISNIVRTHNCKEVILAFSASIDGSILLNYMKIVLKDLNVKMSHLGVGIPINADIDTVSPDTLQIAMKNRKICE